MASSGGEKERQQMARIDPISFRKRGAVDRVVGFTWAARIRVPDRRVVEAASLRRASVPP